MSSELASHGEGELRLRGEESVEFVWVGGEIGFGPRFRHQPAGLGRVEAGESYPAKTLCRQISAANGRENSTLFPFPAIRERCKPPVEMLCTVDGLSRHGTVCTSKNASKPVIVILVVCSSRYARYCT